MIPSAVFVAAVAQQNKILLSNKFSGYLGIMPKTHTHVLSTSGKYMTGLAEWTRVSPLGTAESTLCFLRKIWQATASNFSTGPSKCTFQLRASKQEWKSAPTKIDVLCFSRLPKQCILQVSGNTLQQMKCTSAKKILGGFSPPATLVTGVWTSSNDWKNIFSRTSARDGIFAKSSGCVLRDKVHRFEIRQPRESPQHFSESKNPSYVGSAMYRPGKIGEASPAGYTRGKAGERSKDQVAWLHLRPCMVPPLCGQRELSDIAVDREVFRVDLGLLPPRPPSKEKRARKWMNEYGHGNFLFVKLSLVFCQKWMCVQTIRLILRETCIFMKIS